MRFEDAGRAIDSELVKLRKYLDKEIRPQTRQEAVAFLRKSADRLTKMAERLEKEKTEP